VYYPITYHESPESTASTTVRRTCLVEGCPCKDARMVSRRRAAFHAAMARNRGQTADRIVPVDPEWSLA
jgi:hypothetical protein